MGRSGTRRSPVTGPSMIAGLGLAWLLAGPAIADQHEASATGQSAAATADASAGAGSEAAPATAPGPSEHVAVSKPEGAPVQPAAHDPEHYPSLEVPTKPWAYDTSSFFALTRGLDEETDSDWGRRASMVGTVPLDVVALPAAALAGLFGS